MDEKIGTGKYMNDAEFTELTEQAQTLAMENFNMIARMGNQEKIEESRKQLLQDIAEECDRYKEINNSRNPYAVISNYSVCWEIDWYAKNK